MAVLSLLARASRRHPLPVTECVSVLAALGSALLSGCASGPLEAPEPQRVVAASEVSPAAPLAGAREEATDHFYRGKALALAGEPACARQEFQKALDVFRDRSTGERDDLDFAEQLYESVSLYDRRAAASEQAVDERPPAESSSDSLVAHHPSAGPEEIAAAEKEVATASSAAAFDIPVVVNDRVLAAVAYYQFRTPIAFASALQRGGRYLPLLRQILKDEGLPQDLVYVAMIESAFKSGAHSRKAAHGFWQFIPGTGRRYGLRRTRELDERSDVVKSTKAAAAYFRDLYEMFGDWHLAMAAYDAGEGRILRALQATGARDYWELTSGNVLVREVRDYVPFVMAAALISHDPAKFGFDVVPDPPLEFDVVDVDRRMDLAAVARATGTSLDEIRSLNSELKLRTTPRGPYALRVPRGTAETLLAALPGLPVARETVDRKVVVKKGDTLARIARRHHVPLAELCEQNDLAAGARLKRGTVLVLPARPTAQRKAATPDAVAMSAERARGQVRAIPTPSAAIASAAQIGDVALTVPSAGPSPLPQRYDIPAEGFVSAPAKAQASAGPRRVVYTVRRGDTLFHIAREHGVSVDAIRRLNRLGHRGVIAAGQRLTLSK